MITQDDYETGIRLWKAWTEMWNGQPEIARAIVADHFVLHLTTPNAIDPATVDSAVSVERWVTAHRAKFGRLEFHAGFGPFVDVRRGVIAGPWYASTIVDGTARPVCGMDTIGFRDGKITEYWTLAKEVDAVGGWCASSLAPSG